MSDNLIEKIELARLKIFSKDMFLGYVLQHINIYLDDEISTAATNGKTIMFGKKFLKKLSLKETIFVLLHELMHILLEHPSRGKKYKNQKKYNVAADIVVNDILVYYGYSYDSLRLIRGEQFYINGTSMTAEEIYENWLEEKYNFKTLDQHDLWDNEEVFEEIKDIISQAVAKGYDTKTFNYSRFVNEPEYGFNSTKWKELLKRYITKDIFDYSFNKVDNRYQNVLLPAFIEDEETLKNIWFVLDVSGSMTDQDIALVYGEIERIIKHYKSVKCDISFFSLKTTPPLSFKNRTDLKKAFTNINSRGGTSFVTIFKDMIDFYPRKLPSLVVVLTDGLATYPTEEEKMNVPVIWCLTREKNLPPNGEYILIKSKRSE